MDRVSDAFVALDKDWHYTFLNEKAASLFGRRPEDLLGKHIWTEFPEGIGQPFHLNYERAMREQVPITFEDYYAPWDRWFENRVYPSQGGLSIFFHEITERKKTDSALKESERRFRETLENVELLAVTLNLDGTIAFSNDHMLRLLGWTRETLIGRSWFETFLPPEGRTQVEGVFGQALRAGTILKHYENEILTRGGGRRLIRWNNTVLKNAEGAVIGTVSLGEDITERRRVETLLSGQKRVLEMTAAGVPLSETLTELVRLIEGQSAGMLGSILLLGDDRLHVRHGAAPSLPPEFVAAVDGQPIGPCAGSCGTAAYRREAVYVEDIATDPLWVVYKQAALPHGLRACWSTPVFDSQRSVLGLFAMYYRQPGLPQAEHLELIEIATHTAAIAINSHRVENTLRESEARYRTLFEYAPDGILIADPESTYLDANESMCRMLGYRPEELIGLHASDIVVPSEFAHIAPALSAIKTKSEYHREWQFRRKDESVFGAEVDVTLMPDGNFLAMIRDVTERKKAEAAIAQRAAQLAALNTLANNIASTLDLPSRTKAVLDGVMKAVAPDLALLFLREGEDLQLLDSAMGEGGICQVGTPVHRVGQCLCGLAVRQGHSIYSLDIHLDQRCAWEECEKTGLKSFAVLPLKNGEEIHGVLALASVNQRDFQQQEAFLETMAAEVATGLQNALLHQRLVAHAAELEQRVQERTAMLREANEDLAQAVEHAQAADKAKSAFLSAMSHELRTPLNSVIGFTGVLLRGLVGGLTPEQREPLEIVQRNGRHLLALINDVLDLSKIEAEEMRLSALPFDLVQTLREALESMSPAAAAKGLSLNQTFEVETLPVLGDQRRVAQILLNLLSNAVKFTESGGVTLHLTLRQGWAHIAVRDTGPGISETDLPRLFHEFEQLDSGLARRSDGTGLGLALSRRLARLMDGDILVESQLEQGSTFTLVFPLTVREKAL